MISPHHRVFCSYAYTGEDANSVKARMRMIVDAFKKAGVEAYSNLDDPKTAALSGAKAFIDAALAEMQKSDLVFVVMSSDRRSEGMLIEVGAAYAAGKPIVLARHHSAHGKTYLDQLADKTIDWQTDEDLRRAIKALVV